MRSDDDDESDETGFVAVVPVEVRRDKTLGRVTVAGDCIDFEWESWERPTGGATGIHDASELIGFFIHDSVLWLELVGFFLRTDSPRLAFKAVASNLTLP